MLKRICPLLMLLPMLASAAVPPEFKVTGLASWQLGRLMINGIPFTLDNRTRFDDGLTEDTLGGTWVELEGVVQGETNLVHEIDRADRQHDHDMDIVGTVQEGRLWGYGASDDSLNPFEGRWADLECRFDGKVLSACRRDD
ncbi:DUF5666 domain-containing protein [Aeromonas simiae]|uniref:DUF5666 domain-containing protein n=1 Tax=Aeromonas simiae TaxID=218936 RepID=UPI0005A7BC10|nr:DUF5666 domain-containing protein [Aeromonas simiae]